MKRLLKNIFAGIFAVAFLVTSSGATSIYPHSSYRLNSDVLAGKNVVVTVDSRISPEDAADVVAAVLAGGPSVRSNASCPYYNGSHHLYLYHVYHHYRDESDSTKCITYYEAYERCRNGPDCTYDWLSPAYDKATHTYGSTTCDNYPALPDDGDALHVEFIYDHWT